MKLVWFTSQTCTHNGYPLSLCRRGIVAIAFHLDTKKLLPFKQVLDRSELTVEENKGNLPQKPSLFVQPWKITQLKKSDDNPFID